MRSRARFVGRMLRHLPVFGPLFLFAATPAATQDLVAPDLAADELVASDAALLPDAGAIPLIQEFLIDRSDRMTVDVRINDSRPYPFVVDTGAERTVIANDLARALSLESGPVLTLATISGRVAVPSFLIDNLNTSVVDIGGLEAPGLERADLGAFGLLGIDSLEDRRVLMDFRKRRMEVLDAPKIRGRSRLENGMIVVQARRQAGRMILSSAEIGGARVDLIIDTGAQSSMGNEALRHKLRSRRYERVTLRSVTGAELLGDYTQIKQIQIGALAINDLPITFADNYAFKALNLERRPAILLGMDALRLFDRVVVDFANRRVAFDLPASAGF